ncbi:hypothetical protein ACIBHY_03205 [Nonomuraea sp. NPDC050547]|uniref:hypothetical protein n=1 Tax=Nonomuraea sp. NPDC050547 TaxID=3364368 RepID=UPI00379C2C70
MKRTAALLVLALCLSACGGTPPAPSTSPPQGLTVTLTQGRSDMPKHMLSVVMANAGSTPVWVSDVRVSGPSFQETGFSRMDTAVKSVPVALRIAYGAAKCAPGAVPELRPARVIAHVKAGDEPSREVSWALPHPDPLLAKLFREECEQFLVQQAVSVGFGPAWTEKDKVLQGSVIVTRRNSNEDVTVTELSGNVHYELNSREMTLKAGMARLEIPVRITPGRCDPHSFAEAKIAMLFNARVALGTGEPRFLVFRSDTVQTPSMRLDQLILGYARKTCGL